MGRGLGSHLDPGDELTARGTWAIVRNTAHQEPQSLHWRKHILKRGPRPTEILTSRLFSFFSHGLPRALFPSPAAVVSSLVQDWRALARAPQGTFWHSSSLAAGV